MNSADLNGTGVVFKAIQEQELQRDSITPCILVDSSTVIYWMSSFVI